MTTLKVNQDALLTLEQPLIRVPLEQLKKTFRNQQRLIEKELQNVQAQVKLLMDSKLFIKV
jgi:macrophage erythroblast attacher